MAAVHEGFSDGMSPERGKTASAAAAAAVATSDDAEDVKPVHFGPYWLVGSVSRLNSVLWTDYVPWPLGGR